MLKGPESGCLRPLLHWLCRNPTRIARGRLTTSALLPRSRTSAPQRSQSLSRPERHESPATNSSRVSRPHFHPSRLSAVPHGTSPLACSSVSSSAPTLPVDKNGRDRASSFSVTPDGRVARTRQPHSARRHIKRKCPAQRRRTLLWVMLTTQSPERAWRAYQELHSCRAVIPPHSLHQLVRLLASVKPRTRTVYLQLLSVLKTLQRNGGRLRLWEWNTLIDCAGKQWRKTRLEDYEHSLDIFNKKGALPAGNVSLADVSLDSAAESCSAQQDPDIWTYNIILSIASRSTLPFTVRHALSLLLTSGLSPDRYTHLCLLRYFAVRNDLRSVRATLRKIKEQGLEVGLDGINACLWAYARNGRFDVAMRIYRVLRSHVHSTPSGEHNIDHDSCYIRDTVGLDNLDSFEPDETTYTMMIQALAYHGDLRNALSTFVDMLTAPNRAAGTRTDGPAVNPACYKPSMAAFRGLFLGFARHGRDPGDLVEEAEPVAMLFPSPRANWDLDTLETIFAAFLRLSSRPKPTGRLVYWILVAFNKTSGNDPVKLREVWTKLEVKYGCDWGGRMELIRRSIFTSGDVNV